MNRRSVQSTYKGLDRIRIVIRPNITVLHYRHKKAGIQTNVGVFLCEVNHYVGMTLAKGLVAAIVILIVVDQSLGRTHTAVGVLHADGVVVRFPIVAGTTLNSPNHLDAVTVARSPNLRVPVQTNAPLLCTEQNLTISSDGIQPPLFIILIVKQRRSLIKQCTGFQRQTHHTVCTTCFRAQLIGERDRQIFNDGIQLFCNPIHDGNG